jgi:hypothetical protein
MNFRRIALIAALPLALAACGDNNTDVAPPAGQAPAQQPAAAAPAASSTTPAPAPQASNATPASGDLDFLWGTWAANLTWCTDQTNGSPITISQSRFEGAENSCDITSLSDNGDGSYSAQLSCQGEGQTNAETLNMTPVYAPSGEGIVLQYPDRGNERTTVLRCS